jgi:AbrB family looped-hinge helix DNA binding protein
MSFLAAPIAYNPRQIKPESYPLTSQSKIMQMSSDGQITIPLDLRNQLGISPATDLEFEVEGDGLYLKKIPSASIATWIKVNQGCISNATTAQIMGITRGDDTP